MELLIELLLDLIFESSIEISSNKKVTKWIRYPLIVLISLFYISVIVGLLILGILIIDENIYVGLLLIILCLIFLVLGIIKFKKIYIEKNSTKLD